MKAQRLTRHLLAPEVLGGILLIVLVAGFSLSIFVFINTVKSGAMESSQLCYTSNCFEAAIKIHKSSIDIIVATFGMMVALATTGGIVVALLSYRESVRANTLSNHIGHLALFQAFIDRETAKLARVSAKSIDSHQWYVLMFPHSRAGNTAVSNSYVSAVKLVAEQIATSNRAARSAIDGSFRFVDHQERMISALKGIGISITRHTRVDFYDVEIEVFSLLKSVNSSFCYGAEIEILPARVYR